MSGKLDNQLTASLMRLEEIVVRMQRETDGVPISTVSHLFEKRPDVCTGADIVSWIKEDMKLDSRLEALGVAKTIAKYGYIYQAIDSKLIVKDDQSYYRFQSDHFWPTKHVNITNIKYAIHLCKRLFSNKNRSNLDTAEMEHLGKLQQTLGHLWEQIWYDAEASYKIDKKRSKNDKIIVESQERAFWNLHKHTADLNYVLAVDQLKFKKETQSSTMLTTEPLLTRHLSIDSVNSSEPQTAIESLVGFTQLYQSFDPLMRSCSDGTPTLDYQQEMSRRRDSSIVFGNRVEMWSVGLEQLLKDDDGVEAFLKHLEKEHSSENLLFWLACEEFRALPLSELKARAEVIYKEFLSRKAQYQVNLDSRLMQEVRDGTSDLNHFTFYAAQQEIFRLMKSDSYPRFLKSDTYLALLRESQNISLRNGKRGKLLSILSSPPNKNQS